MYKVDLRKIRLRNIGKRVHRHTAAKATTGGTPYRRVLLEFTKYGYRLYLHATKGWRSGRHIE